MIVQVSRVDMDARQIDLGIIDGPFRAEDAKEGKGPASQPGQHVIFARYKKRNIATLSDKDAKVEPVRTGRKQRSR